MAKLKASRNEGFTKPMPGHVLLKIEEVKFERYEDGDNKGELYANLKYTIADCIEHDDNVGLSQFDRFNLFDADKKGNFYGNRNLLGVILCATGKDLEVEEDYFNDKKVQSNVTGKLTESLFGAEIIESKVKDKKTKEEKIYLNVKNYMTKDEYKDLKKKTGSQSGNSSSKKSKPKDEGETETVTTTTTDSGDGW
jgi:hypothetical protein